MRVTPSLFVAALLVLPACDDGAGSAEPGPCPVESGDVLPADYVERGCYDSDRDTVRLGSYFDCTGRRKLYSEDGFVGFPGEPVVYLNSPKGQEMYDGCDP